MPGPIPHHLASGIHPGAFVQSTAPDTADVQDGVLWIDTSSGPPFALRVWRADDEEWETVDSTGVDDCIEFASGSRLCLSPSGFVVNRTGITPYLVMTSSHFDLYLGGVGALHLPFTYAPAGHPTRDLVLDATGGPYAVPYRATLGLPATLPVDPIVPVGHDVQMRCGASQALLDHLSAQYSRWAKELGAVASVVGTVALAALFINFLDPMYDVALVGAAAAGTYQTMRALINALSSVAAGGLFDDLTAPNLSDLHHACFCAVTTVGGVVPITASAIAAWRSALPAVGSPGTLTDALLDALLANIPLIDWQSAAQGAGTSSACDTWTCP